MKRRVLIISEQVGWHSEQLQKAMTHFGCKAQIAALQQCSMRLDDDNHSLIIPGFETALPDGVFVRDVPGGSLEEVVFRLDILHALRELGVTVYNDARMIERTVDKAMTSFLLQTAGIATPPCRVFTDYAQAKAWVKGETDGGKTLVYKPLFGSQGKGLKRITRSSDLPDPASANGVFYLQRFIENGLEQSADWRVFVIGGKAMAAMQRSSTNWVTNVANGAQCHPAVLTPELATLAENSLARVGLFYGGVDILKDRDGKYWVLEVNSIPAWRGLQSVTQLPIAENLAADFLSRCSTPQRMEAAG